MAKQWACKCGQLNEPEDSGFSTHKCGLCGRDKWLVYYLGGGAALVLVGLATAIVFMLTHPEAAYRAKFSELAANDALTPEGAELTADEQTELANLKKRFKLDETKIAVWEREERVKLGHDAYRETFTRLYNNSEAAGGNPITSAEREQLNQIAKEQRISPARIAAFETALSAKLNEQRRAVPKELLALLYEIYSDESKSESEQSQLDDLARRQQVPEAQLRQTEREIQQHWQQAKPDFERGLQQAAARDYAGAAAAFRSARQVDGSNPWVLANLAAALLETGQLAEARAAGELALQSDPRNWLAHYNLGCWHARQGERDEALGALSAALNVLAENRAPGVTRTEVATRMQTDESLSSLRRDPRFQQLLAQQ